MLSQPLSSSSGDATSSGSAACGESRKRQLPFSDSAGASLRSQDRGATRAPRPGAVSAR